MINKDKFINTLCEELEQNHIILEVNHKKFAEMVYHATTEQPIVTMTAEDFLKTLE